MSEMGLNFVGTGAKSEASFSIAVLLWYLWGQCCLLQPSDDWKLPEQVLLLLLVPAVQTLPVEFKNNLWFYDIDFVQSTICYKTHVQWPATLLGTLVHLHVNAIVQSANHVAAFQWIQGQELLLIFTSNCDVRSQNIWFQWHWPCHVWWCQLGWFEGFFFFRNLLGFSYTKIYRLYRIVKKKQP